MSKLFLALFRSALFLAAFTVAVPGRAAEDVEKSVVKLNVTKREPDYVRPWTKASPAKVSGSGVVLAGPRILTNAHVVMFASEVFVQLRQGGVQARRRRWLQLCGPLRRRRGRACRENRALLQCPRPAARRLVATRPTATTRRAGAAWAPVQDRAQSP